MNILFQLTKRIIFYGVPASLLIILFQRYGITIEGVSGFKIFSVLAVVCGTIQSVNFAVISKISSLLKTEGIGVWALWRLKSRVIPRRMVAFYRSAIGVLFSVVTGIFSAYMNVVDKGEVAPWVLALALSTAVVSIILLFLTLYEFFAFSQLEDEINERKNRNSAKEKALNSIRKEK